MTSAAGQHATSVRIVTSAFAVVEVVWLQDGRMAEILGGRPRRHG